VSFLTVQSVFAAVALVIAVVALLRARRVGRRLDQVVESYWELRYEYGQLRAQVDRLQGKAPDEPAGSTAFIPLASLRSPEGVADAKAASK
jgi:hypothetical protein